MIAMECKDIRRLAKVEEKIGMRLLPTLTKLKLCRYSTCPRILWYTGVIFPYKDIRARTGREISGVKAMACIRYS